MDHLSAVMSVMEKQVALRAFKAVTDGKQVAFLVPTTILAQPLNFLERLRVFRSVELLSRFRSPEQKGLLKT